MSNSIVNNDNILIVWNESFLKGSKFSSRIGIEERDANGNTVNKESITSETSNSSFPVIYPVNANKLVIAYTENVKDKDQVHYKQIILN